MPINVTDFATHSAAISSLREQVFVVEQHVPLEREQDGLDPQCQHAVIFVQDELVATGRLMPDGHLGRIAVAKPYRGRGFGVQVIEALEQAAREARISEVELAAQLEAAPFYEKLGYRGYGETFMDAGIEHIHMNKVLNTDPQ